MAVRKRANSWQYDFKLPGYRRQRKAGFKTRAEAREAERRAREDLISGRKRILFADAYEQYLSATTMKDRSRDSYRDLWPSIEPVLGHLFVEEVDTPAMDGNFPRYIGTQASRSTRSQAKRRFPWPRPNPEKATRLGEHKELAPRSSLAPHRAASARSRGSKWSIA